MDTLSPTRMMSTPASSAMRAPGASYAVTITSGVPLPLLARTTGAVIALVGMLPPSPSSALLAAGGCRNRTPHLLFDTMSQRACENCARDDELVAVHRVYVVPESWD